MWKMLADDLVYSRTRILVGCGAPMAFVVLIEALFKDVPGYIYFSLITLSLIFFASTAYSGLAEIQREHRLRLRTVLPVPRLHIGMAHLLFPIVVHLIGFIPFFLLSVILAEPSDLPWVEVSTPVMWSFMGFYFSGYAVLLACFIYLAHELSHRFGWTINALPMFLGYLGILAFRYVPLRKILGWEQIPESYVGLVMGGVSYVLAAIVAGLGLALFMTHREVAR